MLIDIVIDTNVLEHASNPKIQFCHSSQRLIERLRNTSILLCVDDGFDLRSEKNLSIIGSQYLDRLPFGSLGHAIVADLAKAMRVKIVCKSVNISLARKLNQMIRNKNDRVFVKVAVNSEDHILTSHDFEDFAIVKRTTIRKRISVSIKTAAETIPLTM